jgi:pyruvate-ferredoxin/flavodoxin oxidoreductase
MNLDIIKIVSVAMGARDEHTLRAFLEAEAYDRSLLPIAIVLLMVSI